MNWRHVSCDVSFCPQMGSLFNVYSGRDRNVSAGTWLTLNSLPREMSKSGHIQTALSYDPSVEGLLWKCFWFGALSFSRVIVLGLKTGSGVNEMMSAAPLGALAEVILEQYGELIEAAIEDA